MSTLNKCLITLAIAVLTLAASYQMALSAQGMPRVKTADKNVKIKVSESKKTKDLSGITPEEFSTHLVDIASKYSSWSRVDERPAESPMLCRISDNGRRSQVRLSEAKAEAEHHRKLYYLHASDRAAYWGIGFDPERHKELCDASKTYFHHDCPTPKDRVPVGFSIVKASFVAEKGPEKRAAEEPTSEKFMMSGGPLSPHREVEVRGEWFHVGAPAGLYIMAKVGPAEMPGTDEGWIYGTIKPDGALSSVGRVESCMGCHTAAPHDRLFGSWEKLEAEAKSH